MNSEAEDGGPARPSPPPPLAVHVIDRLLTGGMENGLVNIINHTPAGRWRHAIVCLRTASAFQKRITRPDVPVFCLNKRDGKDLAVYPRLWRLLRRLGPAVVHTRNLPAVDMVVPAALAGVPVRVHGEHGRDAVEEDGVNRKYNGLRRTLSPLVSGYVTVSRDIEGWLGGTVGVPAAKIVQIYNGVDAERFRPGERRRIAPLPGFDDPDQVWVGTVGRLQTVKDQPTLARAFARLVARIPDGRRRLRLVMVGDGPLRAECERILGESGLDHLAWFTGDRPDVPELMRMLDIFALPSRTEGISNTILEAMATGLPVVATEVGGNPELVVGGETGALVPHSSPDRLADALAAYAADPVLARRHGEAGRRRVEDRFSLTAMVGRYLDLYDTLLARAGG